MKSKILFLLSIFFWFGVAGFSQESEVLWNFHAKFKLTDQNERQVTEKTFEGKKVLWVYFGYSSCPDVCPISLSRVKTAYSRLKSEQSEVQVLFISVDPERDTPKALKEFMSFFNPDFLGLSGSQIATREAANSFRAVYYKTNQKSASGALFAHTDRVFLVDKAGVILARYDMKSDSGKLIQKTREILENRN